MSTDKPESFEDFAKATGLSDLFDIGEATLAEPDDYISATDSDGDSLALYYTERTAEDGECVGIVAVRTDGPIGTALLSVGGMEATVEWLQARIVRAKALAAEQGIEP